MIRKVFSVWAGVWITLVLSVSIFSPFDKVGFVCCILLAIALGMFSYGELLPKIDWENWYDYVLGFNAIAFLGSMISFIVPCTYGLDQVIKWNSWCEWNIIIWLFTILFGIGLIYVKEIHSIKSKWKFAIIVVWILLLSAFIFAIKEKIFG